MAVKIISHFKFSALPDANSINSLIDGVIIVIGTLYPIAQQNLVTFQRTVAFDGKALKAFAVYRTHSDVDNIDSGESIINIEWSGVSVNPASVNVSEVINNDDAKNLLSELPLNDVTEFIEIVSIEGLKGLRLNGINVYIGQRLTLLDLFSTGFIALSEGGGVPYFKLSYLVGKVNSTEVTVYTLQYDIIALAILVLDPVIVTENYIEEFDDGGPVDYNVTEETSILEITTGKIFGVANIEIVINSPFLALNAFNRVLIEAEGIETEYFADQTFNSNVTLDQFGKAVIKIRNKVVFKTGAAANGDTQITLVDIDGDTNLINNPQVKNIITAL